MVEPFLVDERRDYLVVYKPPRMHSAPLKTAPTDGMTAAESSEAVAVTLTEWLAQSHGEIMEARGRNPWEGGIVHRLDYETQGLVLFARNQGALDSFMDQQERGLFIKEYGGIAAREKSPPVLPGFPPLPDFPPELPTAGLVSTSTDPKPITTESGLTLESTFRPFGPGRKAVRPVMGGEGRVYRTGISGMEVQGEFTVFRLRLARGFRHQLRCHLAWLGYPLLNDTLYSGPACTAFPFLTLRAQGMAFSDPADGERREYSLPPLGTP
ncbi:RNA pseudouridine synthase [Spirochaetia bacterium]|nr:RNA pseudouridine synthase [Spirochaetia bacterium]